ncbi:MAG: hypothetical protein K0U41_09925 [Gammaproteobacteria bacterium]|nr:hypothetical protein [Gammaproteobacteria bacterium]
MVDVARARELIASGNELAGERITIEVLGPVIGDPGDRKRGKSTFPTLLVQVSPPETQLEGGVPVTTIAFTITGGDIYIPRINDIATIGGRSVPIERITENRLLGEILSYKCEGNI